MKGKRPYDPETRSALWGLSERLVSQRRPPKYLRIRVRYKGTMWRAHIMGSRYQMGGRYQKVFRAHSCEAAIRQAVEWADEGAGGPGAAAIHPELRAALAAETLAQPTV